MLEDPLMISARFCHARLAFRVSRSWASSRRAIAPCRPFGLRPFGLHPTALQWLLHSSVCAEAVRDARRDPKLLLHETVSLSSRVRLVSPKEYTLYITANASLPTA